MNSHIHETPWLNRTALNITRVSADAAGTVYLSAEQFFRLGMVNMGIQIQAVGATVTPSFTLAPVEYALQEDQVLNEVPWTTESPVAPGAMVLYPKATTAIKLVFSGAGSAYVISW